MLTVGLILQKVYKDLKTFAGVDIDACLYMGIKIEEEQEKERK